MATLSPSPKPTPQQVEEQRIKEKQERESKKQSVSVSQIDNQIVEQSIPDALKPKGANNLGKLILNVGKQLLKLTLPKITSLVNEYGITTFEDYKKSKNINELNNLKPTICPTPESLDKLIEIRNNILLKLTQSKDKLDKLNVTLNINQEILDNLDQALKIIPPTQTALNAGIAIAPVANILGPLQVTVNVLDSLKSNLTPKVSKLLGAVNATSVPIALVSSIVTKIINILLRLDDLIKFCRPDAILNEIPQDLLPSAIEENSDSTYKGFTLKIETIPFNDKLTQNQGVAYNNSNIALLKTSPSFTTNPNVLLNELKLIIDRDNLKAY